MDESLLIFVVAHLSRARSANRPGASSRGGLPEPRYVIFRCSHCRSIQASPLRYSSKRCPYCGRLNRLREVDVLAYASTAADASAAVAKMRALAEGGPR